MTQRALLLCEAISTDPIHLADIAGRNLHIGTILGFSASTHSDWHSCPELCMSVPILRCMLVPTVQGISIQSFQCVSVPKFQYRSGTSFPESDWYIFVRYIVRYIFPRK